MMALLALTMIMKRMVVSPSFRSRDAGRSLSGLNPASMVTSNEAS